MTDNPIETIKSIKQAYDKKKAECDIVWNSHKHGIMRLCQELEVLKADLSATLSAYKSEVEFLDIGERYYAKECNCYACISIKNRISDLKQAIKLGEGQ